MYFENLEIDLPQRLETDAFVLRPITVADAELDYAAVMASRDFLRLWEQSTWPEDDFTVEANREDMELLEQKHANRESFTYTVLNPAETECLGCVYIMAMDAKTFTRTTIEPIGDSTWNDFDVAVYFWVRKSILAAGMDRVLLESLRSWLESDWGFDRALFIISALFTQQIELAESAGLTPHFEFQESGKPNKFIAFN